MSQQFVDQNYKWGFESNIASDSLSPGLDESKILAISKAKQEPPWLLDWRLSAYKKWIKLKEPTWANVDYAPIDYQKISYYNAPKGQLDSLDQMDPEILKLWDKLGIPLNERQALANVKKPVAVDAVLDSTSVYTSFQKTLQEMGILFCSLSKAVQTRSDLIQEYLGSVVPQADNFFSALNSSVFSDGSFVYVPPNIQCPMTLSTYFRINAKNSGQFERTLIIVDKNSSVSYNEGCTAPQRDENQLHAAVVELVALENATVNYQTIQNWYPGNEKGQGGIYNFVTKRGACRGANSKISWTQVETGSAITWKYPSCLLIGDNSQGEFYSVAVTNGHQQADTGTKMIHIGKNTKSTIISKGISAKSSTNTYRGQVKISKKAENAKNYTQCDSLLIGNKSKALTVPIIECNNNKSQVEHEATTSRISEQQLFYLQTKGINQENAQNLIVRGFCKTVTSKLDWEFAVEAQKLLEVTLEGSIG